MPQEKGRHNMTETMVSRVAQMAPRLQPWTYNSETSWEEDTDNLLALARLIDAHAPSDPEGYTYSTEARAFISMLRAFAENIERWRKTQYYRHWIEETARDTAQEIAENNLDATSTDELSDAIWESVDSACPIYTYDIEGIFSESDLDIDSETTGLAGEVADITRIQQIAIFHALVSAVYEELQGIFDEREASADDEQED